jgi:hypothetical protein
VTISLVTRHQGADSDDSSFRDFVDASQRALLRVAELLTGGDSGRAEDLVQQALVKTYLAWPRVSVGRPEAYARAIAGRRRDGNPVGPRGHLVGVSTESVDAQLWAKAREGDGDAFADLHLRRYGGVAGVEEMTEEEGAGKRDASRSSERYCLPSADQPRFRRFQELRWVS